MTDYYVLHSGGMDSTTALAFALRRPDAEKVTAVSINYGQRHVRELQAAKAICERLGVEQITLDLTGYGASVTSALTTDEVDVPDGHYAEDSMKATVVPGRNAVFLAAAAGIAASRSGDTPAAVMTAVHAGDHHIYADCRPEFINAMSEATRLATGVPVLAPFVNNSKTEIAEHAHNLAAPLELTWSCYKGGDNHCGVCGTCVERKEAFTDARLPDPTEYEA